ncbi:hypothetical protein Tco_0717854 [Tanacetum coccineum]
MKKIKCLRGFRHTNDHGLAALTRINIVFLKLCIGFELDKLALVWGKPRQPPLGLEEVRLAFDCDSLPVLKEFRPEIQVELPSGMVLVKRGG